MFGKLFGAMFILPTLDFGKTTAEVKTRVESRKTVTGKVSAVDAMGGIERVENSEKEEFIPKKPLHKDNFILT